MCVYIILGKEGGGGGGDVEKFERSYVCLLYRSMDLGSERFENSRYKSKKVAKMFHNISFTHQRVR